MPKKKKTRHQKMIADKRKEMNINTLYSLPQESSKEQAKPLINTVKNTTVISTSSYKYLSADLLKTAFLTGAIVAIQFLLKLFI